MKNGKIGLVYNGKKIEISSVKKVSEWGKARGLMFRRQEKSPALLFEFKKPAQFNLTSLFVFFPFLVLWLDKKNNVIDKRIVSPFRFHIPSRKPYSKILEIPFNKFYSSEVKNLVGQKI